MFKKIAVAMAAIVSFNSMAGAIAPEYNFEKPNPYIFPKMAQKIPNGMFGPNDNLPFRFSLPLTIDQYDDMARRAAITKITGKQMSDSELAECAKRLMPEVIKELGGKEPHDRAGMTWWSMPQRTLAMGRCIIGPEIKFEHVMIAWNNTFMRDTPYMSAYRPMIREWCNFNNACAQRLAFVSTHRMILNKALSMYYKPAVQ